MIVSPLSEVPAFAVSENDTSPVDEKGYLRIVRWAIRGGITQIGDQDYDPADPFYQALFAYTGPYPVPMALPPATGQGLVSNGDIGVDIIRVPGGGGFLPHTHPGDHLLIVIGGQGTITYDGRIYPTSAGEVYLIEGSVPHAVGAITDHVILAVGSPHRAVGSSERATLVAYKKVLADIGTLHCLICDQVAADPTRLHDLGCSHCPCGECGLEDLP